jgi:hypothetical protein
LKKLPLLLLLAALCDTASVVQGEAGYLVCISRQGRRHVVCAKTSCPKGDRLEAFSAADHPACERKRG